MQTPFQLTEDQASRLLEFESGQVVIDGSVVEELLQIQQARPQWVNILNANVYGLGSVVRAKTTRLGLVAARRAINRCEKEELREILRKEQAACAAVAS